jgi:hypothetical protein
MALLCVASIAKPIRIPARPQGAASVFGESALLHRRLSTDRIGPTAPLRKFVHRG